MADPNKSATGATGGLFGSGTSAFGTPSASAAKPSTTNFSFSSGSTGLFGVTGAKSTTPQTSPAKPGLFGNPSGPGTTTSAPNFFGSTANDSSAAAPGSNANIFGSNTSKPASGSAGNLFGSKPSTSTAATSSSTGGLFGSTTNSASATASPKPGLFGNNTGSHANTPSLTTQPVFGFGASSNTQTSKDGANPSTPTPLFGAGSSAAGTTGTGGLFGAKPTEPAALNKAPSLFGAPATTTSAPSTSSPAPASLFAAAPAKPDSTPESISKPVSNPLGSTSTSMFGHKSTAPAKSSPLAMGSPTPGDTASAAQAAPPTSKPASALGQTTNKPNVNLTPSLLRGKTLEDLVARWNTELDERVEDFKHTADEIAAWDQVLIQNGDQISMLYDELQRIDPIQSSIDQTLDYVETQQVELAAALDDYERQLSSQPQDFSAPGRLRTAAQEREQAYRTAEEVHVQLNDMAASLGTMIAELNTLAGPGRAEDAEGALVTGEDPIVQIAGILNAHLSSLNWIGEVAQELGSKVNELEGRVASTKVEFGLEARQIEPAGDEGNGLGPGSRIPSSHLPHPRR